MARLPPMVSRGAVVRVIAPSGPFDRAVFAAGVEWLQAQGLTVRVDEGVFSSERYLAGSDERRTREFELALAEPDTQVIWVARGGYGATRIVPRLRVEAVRNASKWCVGFSDATVLHALWANAGVASVHGANITTIAAWHHEARLELLALLQGTSNQQFVGEVVRAGAPVTGPVVGGNLTVLAAMAGTHVLPSTRGALVLLEDVGERPYRLDRAVTQLVQAGYFDGAQGVVLGQFTECEEPPQRAQPGVTAISSVADALAPLALPVLAGLPLGHAGNSRAIRFGTPYRLDTHAGTLTADVLDR